MSSFFFLLEVYRQFLFVFFLLYCVAADTKTSTNSGCTVVETTYQMYNVRDVVCGTKNGSIDNIYGDII